MIKVNYLSNKELLAEIHRSKNSYCSFLSPEYANYDVIVDSLDSITPEMIEEARAARAAKMMQADKQAQKLQGLKTHQIKVTQVDASEIDPESICFRVMTFEHIPLAELKEGKVPKTIKDAHINPNFPPFKHYVSQGGIWTEVGRSHWEGGLQNGWFNMEHGRITNKLAMMFMKLVDRYSQRPNWRGYSYLDEMKNQSLLQLVRVGLKFDESRSQNPFSYYTTTMTNSFTGIFHQEKRNQNIRDDILIMRGQTPSITRQVEDEIAAKKLAEPKPETEAKSEETPSETPEASEQP